MRVALAYDGRHIMVKLPSTTTVDVFAPQPSGDTVDADDFLASCRSAGFADVVSCDVPLVVVNDGYRSTPTARILEWLRPAYPGLLDKARFLIATGAHDAPGEQHLEKIFGNHLHRLRGRVSVHDCRDRNSLARVGVDHLGGEVYINRQILDADRVLVIGSVEPHYFAGFTGGRKALFPGLSDFDTIERNHVLANSLQAAPLKLSGNPVAEHLDELTAMIDCAKVFAVEAVTDEAGGITGLFVGALSQAFAQAAAMAEALYARRVADRYDVVLCEVMPPLDSNLYQGQKALENSQAAVVDGGATVIVSACREGVGSSHFYDMAPGWDRRRNVPADGRLSFGSHKLSRVNAITERIDVRLFSELPDERVRSVFFEPVHDIDKYLLTAAETKDSLRLAVVHDAGHTVLTVH